MPNLNIKKIMLIRLLSKLRIISNIKVILDIYNLIIYNKRYKL